MAKSKGVGEATGSAGDVRRYVETATASLKASLVEGSSSTPADRSALEAARAIFEQSGKSQNKINIQVVPRTEDFGSPSNVNSITQHELGHAKDFVHTGLFDTLDSKSIIQHELVHADFAHAQDEQLLQLFREAIKSTHSVGYKEVSLPEDDS
jgi:hypothetical protein